MRNLRRWAPLVLLISLCVAAPFGGNSDAAVTPNSIITAQTPNRGLLQFTSASTPLTFATLYTAGANGSVCKGIQETNSDSVTHVINLQIVSATVHYAGITFTTTANQGYSSGVNPLNILTNGAASGIWPGLPYDQNGNQYIFLASGDTLQATFATAISATDVINLIANPCNDF